MEDSIVNLLFLIGLIIGYIAITIIIFKVDKKVVAELPMERFKGRLWLNLFIFALAVIIMSVLFFRSFQFTETSDILRFIMNILGYFFVVYFGLLETFVVIFCLKQEKKVENKNI